MIERTWVRTAIAVGAVAWVAHLMLLRSGRMRVVRKTNGVRGEERIAATKERIPRHKIWSISELAGSLKSPFSGVSIEDMNPWRQSPSLAWLLSLAKHVWDDAADASAWMSTPHFELDGKTPIQAAMTDAGAERVEALLWRLIHGIAT